MGRIYYSNSVDGLPIREAGERVSRRPWLLASWSAPRHGTPFLKEESRLPPWDSVFGTESHGARKLCNSNLQMGMIVACSRLYPVPEFRVRRDSSR